MYHRYASGGHGPQEICQIHDECQDYLKEFRGFLRNLMMHGAVGTALGGVCTLVGEPQNLLIGHVMGWHFDEFFIKVAAVSMPVAAAGLATCWLVDRFRLFGYGTPLPDAVRAVLRDYSDELAASATMRDRPVLIVQALVAVILVLVVVIARKLLVAVWQVLT